MRTLIKSLVLVLIALSMHSCILFLNKTMETKIYTITEIKSGALYGDGQEGVSEGGQVIQTKTEWNALRKKMNSVNPTIGEMDIDFETKTVIVYVDKIRGSGGYSVSILNASEDDKVLDVGYKILEPTGMAAEVITQPFAIVSVSKTYKPVKFSIIE